MRHHFWLLSMLLLGPALPGCGADDSAEHGTADLQSEHGTLLARFVSDPDPPVVGDNGGVLSLRDTQDHPTLGAQIDVVPWMPAHGHGSSVVPGVEEVGDGDYRLLHLGYTMPGQWELRCEIVTPFVQDQLVIPLQVD